MSETLAHLNQPCLPLLLAPRSKAWLAPAGAALAEGERGAVLSCIQRNTLLSLSWGRDIPMLLAILIYNFVRWFPEVGSRFFRVGIGR